jgi:hypothetical protein
MPFASLDLCTARRWLAHKARAQRSQLPETKPLCQNRVREHFLPFSRQRTPLARHSIFISLCPHRPRKPSIYPQNLVTSLAAHKGKRSGSTTIEPSLIPEAMGSAIWCFWSNREPKNSDPHAISCRPLLPASRTNHLSLCSAGIILATLKIGGIQMFRYY